MEHDLAILRELVVMAGCGVLATLALARLRLPLITVLLLTGTLVGPHGLGLVGDQRAIETVAEVGVVLLLFSIGLEFSLQRLAAIRRLVLLGGSLQVGLTVASVVAVVSLAGGSLRRGLFLGCLAALSSTAIVLKALGERTEIDAPHGRFVVGALIFQDLCVVPMMLLVPVLAGRGGGNPLVGASLALARALAVVAVSLVVARVVVPRLFARVDRVRSRELFVLSVLVVCLGTAWLTALAGLSLALGAFLAGLVLAESDYGHRALSDVLPWRDTLTSVFFMSLGMLFDPGVLVERAGDVLLLAAGLLVGKALVATVAGLAMRLPLKVALTAGVGLSQLGEFGFVLARSGEREGLLVARESRVLFAAAVLTMLVTPMLIRVAPGLASWASRLRGVDRLFAQRGTRNPEPARPALTGHVVLVGYGVAGRLVAKALREAGVPYLVMELNAATVRAARAEGEPIDYGDIASAEAVARARVSEARALVLLINDPVAAERAIVAAHHHAPETPILVRSHYLGDALRLTELGATEVVSDEVEAGVEVLARVLERSGVGRDEVRGHVARARDETEPADRGRSAPEDA